MSDSVCVFKNPGAGKTCIQYSMFFFCANVHFEAKPSEVIKMEGDPSFELVTEFKKKCAIVYIEHVEYIK